MAITTVTTVTENGITFGLSDPIDVLYARGDITVDKIAAFASCGWSDLMVKRCRAQAANPQTDMSVSVTVINSPWQTSLDAGNTYRPYYNNNVALDNYEMYGITFLVYGNDDMAIITDGNYSNYRIVTDCDYQKLYANGGSKTTSSNYNGTVISCTHTADGTTRTYTCMNPSGDGKLYSDVNDTQCNVQPISLIQYGDTFVLSKGFYFPSISNSGVQTPGWSTWRGLQNWYLALKNSNDYTQQTYRLNGGYNIRNIEQDSWLKTWGGATVNTFLEPDDVNEYNAIYDLDEHTVMLMHRGAIAWGTCDVTYNLAPKDWDTVLHEMAFCGVRFKVDNTMYKPIISGGVVTGYTDDPDVETEYDDITNVTGNNVPVAPIPPTPPTPSGDDNIDSMGFDGMSCNVGGPAKYYIMSYNDIHHLIGDFNAHAEPGTSISNNIISCYVNALDWNWSTGSEPIEIYSGGAQTVAFTSDINYAVLTGYNARDIIGSIDVPRMTNTFYDFSPYSTYEVYVPFCGWVALPDTVAGRHIKIYFETDEATCGCKGRVFFVDDDGNGVTVAEITGSFGAPCPIQVIEGGLYKQAMLSNGLQVIGGIASGVMGGASGSGVLAVGGLNAAMQSLGNCLIAGNTNYGQTIGRAGDASGLMCAGKPYLKITYPPIDAVVNNSIFGHTVGYLCNEIGKLSNYHGFTVCGNPHIHISATSSEKEEIKQLLEQGVILP